VDAVRFPMPISPDAGTWDCTPAAKWELLQSGRRLICQDVDILGCKATNFLDPNIYYNLKYGNRVFLGTEFGWQQELNRESYATGSYYYAPLGRYGYNPESN